MTRFAIDHWNRVIDSIFGFTPDFTTIWLPSLVPATTSPPQHLCQYDQRHHGSDMTYQLLLSSGGSVGPATIPAMSLTVQPLVHVQQSRAAMFPGQRRQWRFPAWLPCGRPSIAHRCRLAVRSLPLVTRSLWPPGRPLCLPVRPLRSSGCPLRSPVRLRLRSDASPFRPSARPLR